MWGGGCADYELPGNEAWCNAYGSIGDPGQAPNENCCVCKVLVAGKDDPISLPWAPPDDSPSSFQVSLNDEIIRLNTEVVVEIGYEYLLTNTLITLSLSKANHAAFHNSNRVTTNSKAHKPT